MIGLSDYSAYLSGPTLYAALVGLGVVVGVLTGLFGVGGAFLITPLLNVALGIPYNVAVASSLCFTVGAGASGVARHLRLGNVALKTMAILSGGAICGALLGAMIHTSLADVLGEGRFTLTMHGLFIGVLLLTAWMITRKQDLTGERLSVLQRLPLPPYITLKTPNLQHVSLFGLCFAGLFIGVMKGLLGIGGGVLFMPLLIVVVGLDAHLAVGTSLGVVLMSSIAGTIKYGLHGHVDLLLAMALLAGSTVGIQIGAWICTRLHTHRLRRWFAALVLAVAALIAADFVYKLLAR